MHELQVTERILEVAIEHTAGHDVSKIMFIHLRIGALSDLEGEWIQRYFDYLSRGTLAEEAKLVIEIAPIVVECDSCSRDFEIERTGLDHVECPDCGESHCRLISGREYTVTNMEVV